MLNDKDKKVMMLIEQDATHSNYFFQRVKDLKWFYPLKEKGFFMPERIPQSESGDFLFWNILDYLERVSEQAFQNNQYGKDLIEIIESIVQFSLNKKRINNYHIWWYCVKILNNIPCQIIKDNLTIAKFYLWLSVWTDHSHGSDLAVSDIGEKLLVKFLSDDSTIEYAEAIIDVITKILPGGKSHPFTQREDASLQWHSYWILSAFKKNQKTIGQKCSVDVIYTIADKLKHSLEYKQKDYYAELELGEDVYQLKIARVPREDLKENEIGYKDDYYGCSVEQFSKEQVKKINNLWELHKTEPGNKLKQFTITAENKESLISAIKDNLPAGIEWQRADKLEKKLGFLFDGLYEDYSQIWFRSLASSGSDHASGAEEVLTMILRDILLAKCEIAPSDGRLILNEFLSNRYRFPIFRRYILLCIDKFWCSYKDLFEKFIEVMPNVLKEADYEVELQDILRNHNQNFSDNITKMLKKLINDVPEFYVEKGEKPIAYWKYKWLSPLRESPAFKDDYIKAVEKAEPKGGKPYEPIRSTFEGGFIEHKPKSPLLKEDILRKPIPELVKYLSDFQGADFWHGTFEGEPNKEGLADALQAAVKDDPKKFTDEIDSLLGLGYFYLHRIFRGIKDAWNTNKDLDWEKIFDCTIKYFGRSKDSILKDALKAQGEDSGKGRYIWIVEDIVELIGDGSENDKRAFPKEHFDKVEQVFDLILPLLKGEKRPDTQRDALTYALNTTLGRTIRAYMSFSLRVSRATQRKQENWGQKKYERFFAIGIDAYIWFGCYLPQMKYLDEKYTKEKIEYFSQKTSGDFEWQMFMDGYLTGAHIYPDLYCLMRPSYVKALENKVFEGQVAQRLVEHICIGYLQLGESLAQNNENGQPSLFWKMLNEANAPDKRNRWEEVAGFFWSISGRTLKKEEKDEQEEPSEGFKKKIFAFWEWSFKEQDFVKVRLGEAYPSFLSRMAELTIWLDKIDETSEKWLMLCAPYIELEYRSAFFIEYLTKFDDEESVRRIGKIFKKVLESATPSFRQEEIQLIVERLYKAGENDPAVKTDANDICNAYGRRGVHFLKELFYKNQKK